MRNKTEDTVFIFLFIFLAGIIVQQSDAMPIPEESMILQTGLLPTAAKNYEISQEIEIRYFFDDKIMRISGLTTSGNFFYAYHRIVDDITTVTGKVFVNDKFVPIVEKLSPLDYEETEPKTQLQLLVNYPKTLYATYRYDIVTRVYDAQQNPQENIKQNWGYLSDVNVTVSFFDERNNLLGTLDGKTGSIGYFIGSFYFDQKVYPSGNYFLSVNASDGTTEEVKNFNIFIHERIVGN